MKQKNLVNKIKNHFDSKASKKVNSTSPDFNLREVEIEHISHFLKDKQKILDLGCGNGYSTLIYASKFKSDFLGLDYSKPMINAAKQLSKKIKTKGNVKFEECDVLNVKLPEKEFDVVVTQRLLINLQSKQAQKKILNKIHSCLKPKGMYLMCEATSEGLDRLNQVRRVVGLTPIPNTSKHNFWSLKLKERKMEQFLENKFSIKKIQTFGIYFLISRVVYPLLIKPKKPKYNAKINYAAKELEKTLKNNSLDIGHQRLFVLKKK